jgi:CHASE3 domain sensor protein
MAEYSQAQLLEIAKKVIAQRERDKRRNKAISQALRRLKEAHSEEFSRYLKEAQE